LKQAARNDAARNNWTVLVVEDDPLVRATAVDLFEGLGLRTCDAYNGDDALDLLASRPDIRLVFADVRMPGMDGPALARRIAAARPDVKIVLTSGYVGEEQAQGFRFVPKPLRMEDVAAVVATTGSSKSS
jgi:CheY-like chemotaxis protein